MTVEGTTLGQHQWNSVCLIEVPEGTENVPNLGKETDIQIWKPRGKNKMKSKDPHPKTSCN